MRERPGGARDPEEGVSATPARRRQIVEELGEAFAQDHLELAELERRLDQAARARSEIELADLVRGLPKGKGPTAPAERSAGTATEGRHGSRPLSPAPLRVAPESVPDRQYTIAFWSGRSRKGSWIPARRITAIALQGGVELDFRQALFGAPMTEIHAVAVMGAIEITVPPGVHVDTSGFAVMGTFEDDAESARRPGDGSPTLRITGFALMGAVEIRVRLPGETERQARARKRRKSSDVADGTELPPSGKPQGG